MPEDWYLAHNIDKSWKQESSYSLQPCNFQQTTDYHSCLDHVYTNIDASVGIQEAYWTDHKLVWLQIPF
jgi:hypothetical protein